MYIITKKRGFTLVETLFYIAGLVLLLLVISTILLYMYDWYRVVTIGPRVEQVGLTLVDKITRDIHGSGVIDTAQSSLNTTNGALALTGTLDSVPVTRRFSLLNGCVAYQQNGGVATCLSPNGMTVTRLLFIQADTPISTAVKFDIDIAYRTKQGTTTKIYSGFAILRQSYE
ncbi:MAG: hypothetical protein Q7S72_00010 [Candidatus Taylorbacteria bacterium]|nr:hypothetical protein [Candidatus Taylorbacteria bacterium]